MITVTESAIEALDPIAERQYREDLNEYLTDWGAGLVNAAFIAIFHLAHDETGHIHEYVYLGKESDFTPMKSGRLPLMDYLCERVKKEKLPDGPYLVQIRAHPISQYYNIITRTIMPLTFENENFLPSRCAKFQAQVLKGALMKNKNVQYPRFSNSHLLFPSRRLVNMQFYHVAVMPTREQKPSLDYFTEDCENFIVCSEDSVNPSFFKNAILNKLGSKADNALVWIKNFDLCNLVNFYSCTLHMSVFREPPGYMFMEEFFENKQTILY